MPEVQGISSSDPDPRAAGEPSPRPHSGPGPEHGAVPERRPAGELESTVLAALWAADAPLTPGQVQGSLGAPLARTTVTTILTRLYEKGTVSRTRSGRGFAYTPTEDAPGLTARRMHSELQKEEDRSTVLARFVSQLTDEDEQLLRRLLDGDAR
ncbi:BlaI/MecI/CopY family transcriptional regulator [Streptomyces sp. JH14]|uniref:BlaI/MecI/CopY family transcriptional regulator n=1 Tax=Streptomyces sp. JH14 TaxID=2793630 RepID=UPI0023F82E11|nr:BlaI/MecI/CopY family transcriptional regulator [Streptomyces sp. JH14]MDF6040619.1 BlaI/MecI/CopY family transcriptional regulator [Streptomyces sp. JH14]